MQIIDVRSDTVTRPTPAMLDAMRRAKVGDDVFGDDESVNRLQEKAAALFGMEAALFCPTGTMTNQVAIKVHTRPGDEVICDHLAHIYRNEGGGIAMLSGASTRCLHGDHGRFTARQVEENINPPAANSPVTRLVAIENTVNKGGGCCWDLAEVRRIRRVCVKHGLAFHLDGARLFNALVARGESPGQYGRLFHTLSICLSKGLGAPAGSVLLGSRALIAQAHRIRKVLGGGMRQAGYLAAAGIHALDHHVRRLRDDHRRAKAVENSLHALPFVASALPVETNIVIFRLAEDTRSDYFLGHLERHGVKAFATAPQTIRLVLHLDIDDAMLERLVSVLGRFRP